MVSKSYTYNTREQLDDILQLLLGIHTARVFSVRIDPRVVTVELDKEIEIEYAADNVLDEIRRKEVKIYDYDGKFTPDVLFAIIGELKEDKLVPGFLVIHPNSVIKKLPHWRCAAIETVTETSFMGMIVVEDGRIDKDGFVLSGCSGNNPRIYTITKSYTGTA